MATANIVDQARRSLHCSFHSSLTVLKLGSCGAPPRFRVFTRPPFSYWNRRCSALGSTKRERERVQVHFLG